ncbi:UDP-glycosyltransferase UGT5-like [Culicoides brevitarsis]|uniref:UDP-glycosyltransferase UGT5-like n=1 Tax=Culicoides brevitarsis TaxID=469753 RepID=UPI00307C01B7
MLSSTTVSTFLLLAIFLSVANSYKILVIFPTGSFSHQRPQQVVSRALADAGHEVTIISPNPFETQNPNIKQININFTYECMKVFDLSKPITPFAILDLVITYAQSITERILEHPEVWEIYQNGKNEKFDAVIMEPFSHIPLYAIRDILNTTFIGMSSTEVNPTTHRNMGNVIHPILHPSFFIGTPKNPTLLDRIYMTYYQLYIEYWQKYLFYPKMDEIIKKYFPQLKSTAKTLVRFDMLIEGVTMALGRVRPLVPNTVQIGFLHVEPPKALPTDLQRYLDNSKKGVVYLSFGSNVKSATLRPEIRQILINTIRRLDFDVLWKFEEDKLEDKPENVRIEKWLPQQDVLAHKNIKLFIMQGGLQSMDETIDRGVPVVVVPFFGDQYANAAKIERLGIGRRVNVNELDKLEETVLEVIGNPK